MSSLRVVASGFSSIALACGLAAACTPTPKTVVDTTQKTVRSTAKATELFTVGRTRELRERKKEAPHGSPDKPPLLIVAIDGVDRGLLYEMTRAGELPGFARLLGGRDASGKLPHAYFEERLVATMPSVTLAAWATALTGVPPAVHGITGNEFFMRGERKLGAPVPDSFSDTNPTLDSYTIDYADSLLKAPTVFERLREGDPDISIWVSMQHLHRGADRLLFCDRDLFVEGVEASLREALQGKVSRRLFEKIDEQAIDTVVDELGKAAPPDVLHLYITGADMYAHVAPEGPDVARRRYLAEIVDKQLVRVLEALEKKGAFAERYVVVTADHGHTQVLPDDKHALFTDEKDDPPAVLTAAGFKVRPFEMEVRGGDYQAVLTYQGPVAYVYLADRAGCPRAEKCAWQNPPRYREDVLAAAEAFHLANVGGTVAPKLKGTLDMIFVREPRPMDEDDLPFQVYVGGGKVESIAAFLKRSPHPTYIQLEERMRDLAAGPRGERAGDVVLLAHNGDRTELLDRYYFAQKQHSWHGSPSRADSEIPLIVARVGSSTDGIQKLLAPVLGDAPRQQKVTDVILALRASKPARPAQ